MTVTRPPAGRPREVGLPDIDRLHALVRASDIADTGEPDMTRADVVAVLSGEGCTAWALTGPDGEDVAAAWIERREGRPALDGEVFLAPGLPAAAARPVLDQLLAAAAADPARRPLHVFCHVAAAEKAALLAGHGGVVVRHFFRMVIPLAGRQVDVPDWPAGAELRSVRNDDEDLRRMHHVIGTAFQDHWGHASSPYDAWQRRHRNREDFDPSLWRLVLLHGEPVGGLMASTHENDGYVMTLGVLREARGLGLAKRLLLTAFEEFRRRGLSRAALHVDATSPTGAVRLYESAGMTVAARWACYELQTAGSAARSG